MIKLPNEIRFVHGNHEVPGLPRFTIAYHRDAHRVMFAWVELFHKDKYEKAVGREQSETRLVQNLEFLMTAPVSDAWDKQKIGVIQVTALHTALSSVIADHVLSSMSFMDVKHSFISDKLAEIVVDSIQARQY